ncbi:MAG TPA: hypothetical protein VHO24_08850 [Opitutaceae bacterium]|nr:hypothetical protein [Opitutaceae bacterium]
MTAAPAQNSGPAATGIVAFTLCEPAYLVGAAALFNSLIASGFQGTFIVGLKGGPGGWLLTLPAGVPAGVNVRVIAAPGDRHLTHGKALFARRILDELEPACTGIAYFDPDVVVKAKWSDITARILTTACVCADENAPPWLGQEAPWSRFAAEQTGLSTAMDGACCNGGFVGALRAHRAVLDLWEKLILACVQRGFDPREFTWNGERALPFFFVDQDMLNLAIRLAGAPVWIGGPETMDFRPGGNWLSHAISTPKPWGRWYLPRVLAGRTVRQCDVAFWENAAKPIPAVPAVSRWFHRLDLALARSLSHKTS